MRHQLFMLGGVAGFLGVLIGAFGAHGLKEHMTADGLKQYETGVDYHLVHAAAILGLAAAAGGGTDRLLRGAGWAFAAGIVLFSGALYVLALSGMKWLGMVAPLGGLSYMAGWLLIALAGWRSRR